MYSSVEDVEYFRANMTLVENINSEASHSSRISSPINYQILWNWLEDKELVVSIREIPAYDLMSNHSESSYFPNEFN